MSDHTSTKPRDDERVRLLECWLPLAQAVCAGAGWRDDAASLEVLVLTAAPTLAHARSAAEARAILTACHSLLGKENQ